MVRKLENKIAVVTGGSCGIGFATAKLFVDEGAFVYITGRRKKELDEAVGSLGENASGIQGDVASLDDLTRLYETIKEEKGRIDILFANAGIGGFSPLEQVTEDHFDKIFDINVRGLLFSVQKALPLMTAGGSIILSASIASTSGIDSLSVYSASKAAVRSFARCWTAELAKRQIRVNVISPGVIPTPSYSTMPHSKEFVESISKDIPLGRPGQTEEIAKAVLFLASDDSSYVTGIELPIDGGLDQV